MTAVQGPAEGSGQDSQEAQGEEEASGGRRGLHLDRVSRVGAGLHSLLQVPELQQSPETVGSLCLHGNNISAVEGIEPLRRLMELNLSSNLITSTLALRPMTSLRKLDLSSNQLQEVEGLGGTSPEASAACLSLNRSPQQGTHPIVGPSLA